MNITPEAAAEMLNKLPKHNVEDTYMGAKITRDDIYGDYVKVVDIAAMFNLIWKMKETDDHSKFYAE